MKRSTSGLLLAAALFATGVDAQTRYCDPVEYADSYGWDCGDEAFLFPRRDHRQERLEWEQRREMEERRLERERYRRHNPYRIFPYGLP